MEKKRKLALSRCRDCPDNAADPKFDFECDHCSKEWCCSTKNCAIQLDVCYKGLFQTRHNFCGTYCRQQYEINLEDNILENEKEDIDVLLTVYVNGEKVITKKMSFKCKP